jgi:5-formyltetrahydrofolate cyclo-ligase
MPEPPCFGLEVRVAERPGSRTGGPSSADEPTVTARKRALRRRLRAARLRSPSPDADAGHPGAAVGAALARAAGAHFADRGWPSSIAGYLSIAREPATGPLIEAVAERGARVIVPVLRPDGDLDWARHTPGAEVAPGPRGTIEPTSPPLGVDAICTVDVVFVPALAVDHSGRRLGRGGGSYDRALARLRATGSPALVLAVVHDDELLDEVPADPHDQPVDGVLTPSGLALFHRGTPS